MKRHKPLLGSLDTHRAWKQRTQDNARRKAQQAPSRPKDTGPTRKTRRSLAERSGGTCEFPACFRAAVHDHHIGARGMGGSKRAGINDLANQLHLCAEHHRYIEAHPAESYRNGWMRRDGEGLDTPVLTRHGRVVLDSSGGTKPATGTHEHKGAA